MLEQQLMSLCGLYKDALQSSELTSAGTISIDRDESEDVVWDFSKSLIQNKTVTNPNLIYDGITSTGNDTNTYSTMGFGIKGNWNNGPYSFAFKLKDGKETNIFNQIVIGSVPNSTVGNVGLFEIYGGQTLAEAQAETNLLQTFDVRTTATSAYASDPVSEQTRFTFDWDPTTGTFTNETQHTIG